MTAAERLRIDKTIEIAASPERVWRALTSSEELSAWFKVTIEGAIALDSEVFMTSTHAGYEGQRFRVRITEMTPPRRFAWQWHPGVVDPAVDYSVEPRTTVTFTLEPTARGTRLSVSETGFEQIALARRAKVFQDNSGGWAEVIGWIKSHVEKTS
jgi:uncharacterized protein YndB with AHSA1/START domain